MPRPRRVHVALPQPIRRCLPRPVTVTMDEYQFRVRPGLLRVSEQFVELPYVVLVNRTDFPVTFRFEPGWMAYLRGGPAINVRVRPRSQSAWLVVARRRPGRSAYAVRVNLGRGRGPTLEAVGGSRPEVEVKP
jgi:hypothetical protein